MGFGADALGAAALGLDLGSTTAERIAVTPVALEFDGLTLDFPPLDANGRFISAHPVDTKVFHRLRIVSGSMRSAPATGNDIGNQAYIDPLTIEAQVRDQVRLALEDMVAAGDITDRGLELDLSVRGRVALLYTYTNLRSGKPGSFRSP